MLAPSPSVIAVSEQQMECSTPHTLKVQMRLKYKYELYNGVLFAYNDITQRRAICQGL